MTDAADDRDDETDGAASDPDGGPGAVEDQSDDESEWEYSLEDIEQREADAEAAEAAERRRQEPLEPGDPSVENALFVVLGVLLTLFVISRLFVA